MCSLFCGSFALLQTEHIFVLEINLYVFLSWCHGCCCTCSRVTPTPIIPLSLQLGSIVTVLWLAGIFPMPSATVRLAEFGSFCNVLSGLLAPIERKCVGCPHWLVTTIPLSLFPCHVLIQKNDTIWVCVRETEKGKGIRVCERVTLRDWGAH